MSETTLDPLVALRMQAIEQHFSELDGLTRQLPNFQPEGLSKKLKADLAGYSEKRAQVSKQFRDLCTPILQALARIGMPDSENPELVDVLSLVDAARANRLVNLEAAVKLALFAKDLAGRAFEELTPKVGLLQKAYEETLAQVKEDLEMIGQGIVTTQAGKLGVNDQAAQHQFEYLAKQNVRVQKAHSDLDAAKMRLKAIRECAPRCQRQAEKIRGVLSQIAIGEIRI